MLLDDNDAKALAEDPKFYDAPSIHAWSEPKHHAAIVRSRIYARCAKQILLWAAAEDTPKNEEHRNMTAEELEAKRQ